MTNKRLNGQFYTITNPFFSNEFMKWFENIPNFEKETILEPFAGSNNIVKMVQDLGYDNSWKAFDIEPGESCVEDVEISMLDTISDFPTGYKVCITNPPYLAKNSAVRRKLPYLGGSFDDLYKQCIQLALNNCDYVAAIIPESFITAGLFHERLETVISLTCKMFSDTDCPVCLALFSPLKAKVENTGLDENNFYIYSGSNYKIGTYADLQKFFPVSTEKNSWKFNDPYGNIGIKCVDSNIKRSIQFIPGDEIDSKDIKISSRAFTRISGLPDGIKLDKFLKKCNKILGEYRDNTYDAFLTSFKGLRKDGLFRRRLDFKTARMIMDAACEELTKEKKAA